MPSFVDRAVRWLQGKNAGRLSPDDVYVFIKYDTDDIFLVKAKVMSFVEKTLKVEITCRDIVNAIHAGDGDYRSYLNNNPNVRQEFTYRNIILRNDHYSAEVDGEPLFAGFPSETSAIAAAKVENPRIQAKNISKTIDKLKIAAHKWRQAMMEQMEERQRARETERLQYDSKRNEAIEQAKNEDRATREQLYRDGYASAKILDDD